jgi:Family of unknown function (DUF695)
MKNTVIPEEVHTVLEFCQRDLPGFATVNAALREFEPKVAFSWHLSLLLQCVDLIDNRLPSPDEQELLYKFEDGLDPLLKADGNALFLARVTHDGLRELTWRIHEPEAANAVIQKILRTKDQPRPIDYRMEEDPQWQRASWCLNNACPSLLKDAGA